jgi:hypothetical protein
MNDEQPMIVCSSFIITRSSVLSNGFRRIRRGLDHRRRRHHRGVLRRIRRRRDCPYALRVAVLRLR